MNLKVMLETYVTDEQGNKTQYSHKEAKSFVQGIIVFLMVQFKNAGSGAFQFKDTTGTLRTIVNYVNNFNAVSAAGTDTRGIVVGTGSTAVTVSDFQLNTQIANGAGAGQLNYGATAISDATITATTASFQISRTFQNVSGGTIVVNEIGLYAQGEAVGPIDHDFMYDRTMSTTSVSNTLTLTATYTISVTV